MRPLRRLAEPMQINNIGKGNGTDPTTTVAEPSLQVVAIEKVEVAQPTSTAQSTPAESTTDSTGKTGPRPTAEPLPRVSEHLRRWPKTELPRSTFKSITEHARPS